MECYSLPSPNGRLSIGLRTSWKTIEVEVPENMVTPKSTILIGLSKLKISIFCLSTRISGHQQVEVYLASRPQEYILSIPSFVQACQVFVALVPPVLHHETHQVCNYSSWFTRGWCRTELWCKMMLGNQDLRLEIL